MADRVVRLADGHVSSVERNAHEVAGRGVCSGEDAAVGPDARSQAPARSVGDEGAGAGHRRGGCGRRDDVRDVLSNFDSLQRTRAEYYEAARFADVFASLKRAPSSLAGAASPPFPVSKASTTRVVADVTLDVPGMAEPATGRLISLPERRTAGAERPVPAARPVGRPDAPRRGARQRDVLRGQCFAPGDRVAALINGRRRWLTIVGIALSPEYVYAIRPGELFPDKRRFGIFWMGAAALAPPSTWKAASTTSRSRSARGASPPESSSSSIGCSSPTAGCGAIPQAQQSRRGRSRTSWPAADVRLHHAAHLPGRRRVHPQRGADARAGAPAPADRRPQGARLFATRELGWHYIKWALVDRRVGAVARRRGGAWLGSGMIALYNKYFRFPDPRLSHVRRRGGRVARRQPASSRRSARWSAVHRAVRIPPAEAMRPEAAGTVSPQPASNDRGAASACRWRRG